MTISTVHILHVPGADPDRDAVVASYKDISDLNVCVHADPDRKGIMPNWISAAKCALEDESSWSLIIQDDATPLGDRWRPMLEQAIWYSPAPVLGLSHFGAFTESANRRGFPYMVGPHLIWGAAVAYEKEFLTGLVPWAEWVYETTGYQHDDRLISAYANKVNKDTAITVRAIFDQQVEKSLVGHGGSNRRPNTTILNVGAPYSAQPNALRTRSGAAREQREWLVSLGTPEEDPEWTYRVVRSGAVQRVRKDGA